MVASTGKISGCFQNYFRSKLAATVVFSLLGIVFVLQFLDGTTPGLLTTEPYIHHEPWPATLKSALSGHPEYLDSSFFARGLSHTGTLYSFKTSVLRALHKGELIIGVAGGSVSVGSGCEDARKSWFKLLQEILTFGFAERGLNISVRLINVAQGATGPDRLVLCLEEILTRPVDILIMEYAINDSGGTWCELLIRRLHASRITPLFLETFSLKGKYPHGFGSAQMYHDTVARYYDVPIISARDALHASFRLHPGSQDAWFSHDNHHPSCVGHATLARLAAGLFFTVGVRDDITGKELDLDALPPLDLSESGVYHAFNVSSKPECSLVNGSLRKRYESNILARKGWYVVEGPKPNIYCTSAAQGEFSIPLNCSETRLNYSAKNVKDYCQVMIGYTRSWQPLGSATVFFNASTKPALVLNSYVKEWLSENKKYTIQSFTSITEATLKIPFGVTLLRIQCTGNSSAPPSIPSALERSTFQLHGIVLL